MGFGIVTRTYDKNNNYHFVCSCGNKFKKEKHYRGDVCEKCNNKNFVYVPNGRTSSSIQNVRFNIIKEDISGFTAQRVIDNYKYSSDNGMELEHISTTGHYNMIADFKEGAFYFKDGKGNVLPFTDGRVQYFIKKTDYTDEFINSFKTNSLKQLLRTVERFHRNSGGWGGYSFSKGFYKFAKGYNSGNKIYQILANCGFDYDFLYDCYDNRNKINFDKTKPHEILGVSKFIIPMINDFGLQYKQISHIQELEFIGADNLKYMFSKLKDECDKTKIYSFIRQSKNYSTLIDKYNYDNKRLLNYLLRDVKLQQGIDNPTEALTLLRDTNKMCYDMETKINEKYPKSLKKDHDIARLNYKVNSDGITEKIFNRVVNENTYKNLEYKNKKYSVIIPQAPSDLIKEGDSLSHCVSSYIKDVCDERCNIYFIRYNDNIKESLLTIEIRNKKIIQVKGKFNRSAIEEEREFIKEWANNKKLTYYI